MEASPLQIRAPLGFGYSTGNPLRLRRCLVPSSPSFRSLTPRRDISVHLESTNMGTSGLEANTVIEHAEFKPGQSIDELKRSYPTVKPLKEKLGVDGFTNEEVPMQQKRTAMIHDFCFGIPFGGLVLFGGFVGFLFSRNFAFLSTGVIFGGMLLALSTCSLKIWKQGKSSLPFILGQAAIAAVLSGKQFQMYSLTKELFPTGFCAVSSAAMLCFYSYVLVSGGNPPPKKMKSATTSST